MNKTDEEVRIDMSRINAKLDDSWNRYYGVGWPWLKARYGRIIGNVTKGPVLDIGCGAGVACEELRKRNFDIIGLDYSDKILENKKGKFVRGRAEELPFDDDSFNTVIMTEVLEHVEDEKQAIAEADRVAEKGACIIVTVPNGGIISEMHVRVFSDLSFRQILPWQINEFDIFHEWLWAKCTKE